MENIGQKYNEKCPGVKRLLREAIELAEATEEYCARPLEDNLFEWHFTVGGPKGSDFEGGVYHGRVILPQEYPMRPPDIVLLTPTGRFETNRKICLSISGHHPESWRPSWSIRTALLALIAFMPSPAEGTIGSLDYSPAERRALARKSKSWACAECGPIAALLSDRAAEPPSREEQTMLHQVAFRPESDKPKSDIPRAPPMEAPVETAADKEERIYKRIVACFLCLLIAVSVYRRWHYIQSLQLPFL